MKQYAVALIWILCKFWLKLETFICNTYISRQLITEHSELSFVFYLISKLEKRFNTKWVQKSSHIYLGHSYFHQPKPKVKNHYMNFRKMWRKKQFLFCSYANKMNLVCYTVIYLNAHNIITQLLRIQTNTNIQNIRT